MLFFHLIGGKSAIMTYLYKPQSYQHTYDCAGNDTIPGLKRPFVRFSVGMLRDRLESYPQCFIGNALTVFILQQKTLTLLIFNL